MISFDQQVTRLKHRIAGLAVNDGYVPLTKANQDDGSILRREILKETGPRARVGNPLWTVETFFTLDGTTYHEIAFVYAISPPTPPSSTTPGPTGQQTQTPPHRTPLVRPRQPRSRPLPPSVHEGRTATHT